MHAKEYIENYKAKFNPVFEEYIDRKIEKAKEIDLLESQALKMVKNFVLSGGKRIRPAIMFYSYVGNGGKNEKEILKTSISIELVHTFLLIHDDIIDKDDMRHGVDTIHERYKKIARKIDINKKEDEIKHFANSMAMLVGDITASMANEVIFNADFPPNKIIAGLNALQEIVYQTIPGEMIDVMMEFQRKASEKEIIRMHEGKTARYTFEGPIHLGWTLADSDSKKSQENLKYLSSYALLVGKAFQLRDDILGVFGNENRLGKPVGSDIIEGKQTILLLKAMEFCSDRDKKFLEETVGKKEIKNEELEKIRDIIKESGSLDYSEELSKNMVEDALAYLKKVEFENNKACDFFQSIAYFITKREV